MKRLAQDRLHTQPVSGEEAFRPKGSVYKNCVLSTSATLCPRGTSALEKILFFSLKSLPGQSLVPKHLSRSQEEVSALNKPL